MRTVGGRGSARIPLGSLQRSPDPLAEFVGWGEEEGLGMERQGRERKEKWATGK